jgi:shikimate kinase
VVNEKWLIIGHRGVGKTSFLKCYSHLFSKAFDLDAEIEKRAQKKIPDIFETQGEASFRALEEKTLRELTDELKREESVMIVVGAGYCATFWPESFKCLWLQRDSDLFPRYFLDRPLVGTSDPVNFQKNFQQREHRYHEKADFVWTMREGEELFSDQLPRKWIFQDLKFKDSSFKDEGSASVLTVFPRVGIDLEKFIADRKDWNLVFEFRNDLWSFEKDFKRLEGLIRQYPKSRFLLSFRKIEKINLEIFSLPNVLSDWDVKLGLLPNGLKVSYLSLHHLTDSLVKELNDLETLIEQNSDVQLKAAPKISSFKDLEILYKWWLQNPKRKNIFPRSLNDGSNEFDKFPTWQWFRLYMKGKQRLNFLREGREGLADQPTLHQWNEADAFDDFAAILGDPVVHSYSPTIHHEVFKKKKMNFFSIPISKDELNNEVFSFFENIGAKAFAVTSPLKKHEVLLKLSIPLDANSSEVHNTLFKIQTDSQKTVWKRANTDIAALKKIIADFSSNHSSQETSWIIWGSGAIAEQAFDLLENVQLFSASQNVCLKKKGQSLERPFLLWAAGDEAPLPPFTNIQKVLDLSYSPKSNARLYGFHQKIPYLSGLEFFEIQARLQQSYWSEL